MMKISNEELSAYRILGRGREACVYALDEKRALKLFNENTPKEVVENIFRIHKASELAGIPVIGVYEVCQVDNRFGIVMERATGESLEKLLGQKKGKERDSLLFSFAESVKTMHEKKVLSSGLPDQKKMLHELCKRLPFCGFSDIEIKRVRSIVEEVSDRNTFIHGDCHPGNAFLKDGRVYFVDLGSFTGCGDPILDICCMYSHYVFLPSLMDDESVSESIGMTREEGQKLYDAFLSCYIDGQTKSQIEVNQQAVEKVLAAKICLVYCHRPEIFSDSVICAARERLFSRDEE